MSTLKTRDVFSPDHPRRPGWTGGVPVQYSRPHSDPHDMGKVRRVVPGKKIKSVYMGYSNFRFLFTFWASPEHVYSYLRSSFRKCTCCILPGVYVLRISDERERQTRRRTSKKTTGFVDGVPLVDLVLYCCRPLTNLLRELRGPLSTGPVLLSQFPPLLFT